MDNVFIKTIMDGFNDWNMDVSDDMISKLKKFNDMVMTANEHMNLTTVTNDIESAKKHFLDSINPYIMSTLKSGDRVIDIGSGAGFPGVPLAIAREDVKFYLLDTRKKRCDFIQDSIDELELKNVTVLWGRAEEYGKDAEHREQYDYATARAVAQINVLAEYLLPFVKVGGSALLYKLEDVEDEVMRAENALSILGGKINTVQKYTTIDESRGCSIVNVKKIEHTPTKYPRKSGLPTKRPL